MIVFLIEESRNKIFKQAKIIKKIDNKKKVNKIYNILSLLIKKNSKLNIYGKIISAQHDNLNNYKSRNKKLFTFYRDA